LNCPAVSEQQIDSARLFQASGQLIGASQSMVWNAFDQVNLQVQVEAANDAPGSPVDASGNANRGAVMQMMCMYVAEFTIHRMSDPLKWWAENDIKKLAPCC